MKDIKIKRKNGSNKYVIRTAHLLDGILGWSLITILVVFFQFTLFDEWLFLDFREKVMYVLAWGCIPISFVVIIIFIKHPHFIIDFDKEYIIIRKVKYHLKDIVKFEYIKNKYGKEAAFETLVTFPQLLSVWKKETVRDNEKYKIDKAKSEIILSEVASVFPEI